MARLFLHEFQNKRRMTTYKTITMDCNEFRNFIHETNHGKPYDGVQHTGKARGDGAFSREFSDWSREFLGFNAPWTNMDMLFYNHGKSTFIAELKAPNETYSATNLSAQIDYASKAGKPFFEFRANNNSFSSFNVTPIWLPETW